MPSGSHEVRVSAHRPETPNGGAPGSAQARLELTGLLLTLLPHHSRVRVLDAAGSWCGEPPALALERASLELGVELLRIEAHPEELKGSEIKLPIVHLGERVEIVTEWTERRVTLKDATGRLTALDANVWNERKRTFLLRATKFELAPLGGASGVRRLIRYFTREKGLLSTVLLFAVGYEALSLAVPIAVQVLINNISFGMLVQPIIVLSLVLLVALGGASALRLLQIWAVEHLVRRFVHRVALDLGARKAHLESKVRFPEHRFFEVTTVDKAFFIVALDLSGLILQVFAATLLLAFYHPILLGFALVLALSAWLAIRLPFRAALRRSLKESASKYALAEWIADGSREADPIERSLNGRVRVGEWLEARGAAFRVSFGQQAALFALEMVFAAALLIVGGRLVISGQLSLGQLVAAELVTTAALVSLAKLGKQMPTVYDLVTSFEKLGHLVDYSESIGREPALEKKT